VPEDQIRAGLQRVRAVPPGGLPPPPAGTIRVQSSDMGTVLIPTAKEK
jgi:hypothetical protein